MNSVIIIFKYVHKTLKIFFEGFNFEKNEILELIVKFNAIKIIKIK